MAQTKKCPCKVMQHVLYTCRLFGVIPVTWCHVQDVCTFRLSYVWLVYSVSIMTAMLVHLIVFTDFSKFSKITHITIFLNNVVDLIYLNLVIILCLCNVIRTSSYVKYLNQASRVIREVDMCASVCALLVWVGWLTIGLCCAWIVAHVAVLWFLSVTETDTSSFSALLSKAFQNYTVVFTIFITCVMNTVIGTLACFEKLTRTCLKYTSVHPLKTIVETNNIRDFLGLVKYEICKENHSVPRRLYNLLPGEQVEYLRKLHEDICLAVYQYNCSLNPQLLFGIVSILIILVVQLYSVIVHIGFEEATPETNRIYLLNCMSVVIHSLGLLIIFKNVQQYKNMVI